MCVFSTTPKPRHVHKNVRVVFRSHFRHPPFWPNVASNVALVDVLTTHPGKSAGVTLSSDKVVITQSNSRIFPCLNYQHCIEDIFRANNAAG